MYFQSESKDFTLLQGDCLDLLKTIPDGSIDLIFTDPPYFLSNGGQSIQAGEIVSVNKGDWDNAESVEDIDSFNQEWIAEAKRVLSKEGSIWISGTTHNIFSVGNALNKLGFRMLNMVTWEKPNPPPNYSCRFFTHSAEWIIWARPHEKQKHFFDYPAIKAMNQDKQQKDVWKLPTAGKIEKLPGKHPTQKPLGLLSRIVLAASKPNDTVLDMFSGSATTGIASVLHGRKYIGIERESEFLELAVNRYNQLQDEDFKRDLMTHINKQIIVSNK